jgi:hypothetical protein
VCVFFVFALGSIEEFLVLLNALIRGSSSYDWSDGSPLARKNFDEMK